MKIVERKECEVIVAGIPAYNEEKTIAKVVLLTQKHVDRVIVCDDGSTDLTAEIAQRLGVVIVRHEKNLGYGAAIQSLFAKAKSMNADVMLTLDSDGQHNPEDIPKLLKPIEDDAADIVIGSRFLGGAEKRIPRYRRIGIRVITRMSNGRVKGKVSDAQSGFRAYSKKAIQGLELQENGMGVSAEILMKSRGENLKVREVSIGADYMGLETSTHNPLRHGASVTGAILRFIFYEKPLEFFGIPGITFFLVGTALGIIFYYYYEVQSHFVPIVFFSSIGLILIGALAIFTAACARARKPALYLGIPGVVSFLVGILFGTWMLQIYVAEHRIVTNIAIASLAFILIGMFTVSTAVTIIREQRRQENKKR